MISEEGLATLKFEILIPSCCSYVAEKLDRFFIKARHINSEIHNI